MRRERTIHYFERLSETSFRASNHTGGAWNTEEQHIAPALGLLAHAIETDRDRRRDDRPAIGRLSYDILGTLPIGIVDTAIRTLRAGRTIELVEATLSHDGRPAVVARAWLMQSFETAPFGGTPFRPSPHPTPCRRGTRPPSGRVGSSSPSTCAATRRTRTRVVLGAHPDPAGRRRAGQRRRPNGRRARHRQRHGHSGQPRRGGVPNLDLT
ncbi:thioesterase family protein, partial [Rhodococcus hoagii]|nr:thioesterase family protein [Prescottella equi]